MIRVKLNRLDKDNNVQYVDLRNGLWFKSHSFSADAQIISTNEETKEAKVLFRDSQGFQWDCTLDLIAFVAAFKHETYYVPEPEEVNISII